MTTTSIINFWNDIEPLLGNPPSPPSSDVDFDQLLGSPPEVDLPLVDLSTRAYDIQIDIEFKEEMNALLEKREFEEILERTGSLENFPKTSRALAHLYRGIAFEYKGKHFEAIHSANMGIELAPEEYDPNLAVKLHALKAGNSLQAGQVDIATITVLQGLQIEDVTNTRARNILIIYQAALNPQA